jgi:hypothetical protein
LTISWYLFSASVGCGLDLGRIPELEAAREAAKTFHDTESLVVFGVNVRLEKSFAVSCKGMRFCNC